MSSRSPEATPAAPKIRPLTPARWFDLEAIFKARGCSVARGCWCMYYRVSSAFPLGIGRADAHRAALKALAKSMFGAAGFEGAHGASRGARSCASVRLITAARSAPS